MKTSRFDNTSLLDFSVTQNQPAICRSLYACCWGKSRTTTRRPLFWKSHRTFLGYKTWKILASVIFGKQKPIFELCLEWTNLALSYSQEFIFCDFWQTEINIWALLRMNKSCLVISGIYFSGKKNIIIFASFNISSLYQNNREETDIKQ